MNSLIHQEIKQRGIKSILIICLIFLTNGVIMANTNCHKNPIIHPPEIKKFNIRIIDSETKEPIPFAYLSMGIGEKTHAQFTVDFSGFVLIETNTHQDWLLEISCLGYTSKKIINYRFVGEDLILISLKPTTIMLQEFILTQYAHKLIDFCTLYAQATKRDTSIETWTCCSFKSDTTESVQIDTSNESVSVQNRQIHVIAFPNPTHGLVTITNLDEIETFQLLDMSGKMLQVVSVTKRKQQIDLSYYPPGMYFINYLDKGKPKTIKIIKN